jgi:hypothetical protein
MPPTAVPGKVPLLLSKIAFSSGAVSHRINQSATDEFRLYHVGRTLPLNCARIHRPLFFEGSYWIYYVTLPYNFR